MSETTNSEPVGKIIVLSGSATAHSSEGQRPLEIGSPIYQDDIIKTASGSQLQLKFIDNTQVSQAENSMLKVDSVVYNPDAADNSNLLLDMMKGTFRTISGEITKDSPTHFMLKSPQGTIGIRGTIVVSEVTDLFEKHGVEELTPGKIVVIEDNFGNIRIFNVPMQLVEFYSGKPVSEVRELLLNELEEFQEQAPLTQDDTPLGYTAPEGSFAGTDSGSEIVPSDFGLMGNMIVRFNSGADLLGVFDSLDDIPGYEENVGSGQGGGDEGDQGGGVDPGLVIDDDPGTNDFTITADEPAQEESDADVTTFMFTVTRTGDIDSAATVNWSVDGTGPNPADADDFGGTLPSGTITFDAGETTQQIMVTVSGDYAIEADESFAVVLLDPATNEALPDALVQAVIVNDDGSGENDFTITADEPVQEESDADVTTFAFTVTRTGDIDSAATVNWSVDGTGPNPADADDFGGTLPSGTITFDAGETTQQIVVTVSGDYAIEADESFTVVLLDPATNEVLPDALVQAVIVNDDLIDVINLADLDGSNGFRLDGIEAGDESGSFVSHMVDVNEDGFGDFVISAPGANESEGESYIVYGDPEPDSMNLSELGRGDGITIDGTDLGELGNRLISHAGDINGDGFDDIIIGVPEANDSAGQTYVIFGGQDGVSDTMDLTDLSGIEGLRIDGIEPGDLSGSSFSSGGDINGDGFDDIIIGAPGADDSAGQTYVVFGGDYSGVVTHQGTEGDDIFTGTLSNDIMIGDLGDDTLNGMGGTDVLYGGAGNDIISIDVDSFLRVNGGGNFDTLSFEHTVADGDNVVNVDLTEVANDMIRGIEKIDLIEGQSDTSLTLSINDILDMSETTDTLVIDGDQGDSVTVTDGWWSPPIESDGSSYVTYYGSGGAVLQVDADIDININSMVF